MLLTILMSSLSILLAQQFDLLLLIKHSGNQGLYGFYIFMFSHHPVSSVKLCFVYRPCEVGTAFTGAEHAPEIKKERVEYLFVHVHFSMDFFIKLHNIMHMFFTIRLFLLFLLRINTIS